LSERRWNAAFDKDGRLDIAGVLRRIQRGVWFSVSYFVLKVFKKNSTGIWQLIKHQNCILLLKFLNFAAMYISTCQETELSIWLSDIM